MYMMLCALVVRTVLCMVMVAESTHFDRLMSIVLSVHPGVQLDTRVDSKKSFCRSVMEGTKWHLTVPVYRTSLFRIGPR